VNEKFTATCHVCGERIGVQITGQGYFAQVEDRYEWRVPLDRTEVESHLLMHSLCTCAWSVETLNDVITGGSRVSTDLDCPVHHS
jgi:hypothetical protein